MDKSDRQSALESLPLRQRDCLRLVYAHHNSKEIGRRLGLSEHTVDGHLRKAIQRLGVVSRTEAARLLNDFEKGTQSLSAQTVSVDPTSELHDPENASSGRGRVREGRATFVGFEPSAVFDNPVQRATPRNGLTGMSRFLLLMIGIALAALLIIAAAPMAEAFQRLADLIKPAHH